MELLLLSIYAAVCIAIFKVFRIPLNKWTVPTAILGGVVFVAVLVLVMNYNHPYASLVRNYFLTTPIISEVSGRVVRVPVEPNAPLKKGDVLFELDATPYKAAVESLQAQLAAAEQQVRELREALNVAIAAVAEAKAGRDQARDSYRRYQEGYEKARAFSERDVEARRLALEQAQAALGRAEANQRDAQLRLEAQYQGEHTEVARIRADLEKAQYSLDHTVTRAPTDGFATQVFLQPGMYAASLPLRPVMVFVPTGPGDQMLAGAFWQNSLQRIRPGDDAEVIFDAVPGRVFKARVKYALPVLAGGQLQPSGELISVESRPQPGFVPVALELTEDSSEYYLPGGVVGSAAIYTEYAHHVALMRKILLRMQSWLSYLFPFH